MKKIISVLFIYTVSLQLSAQQFKVALTEPQDESPVSAIYALPGGGFIAMKYIQDDRLAVAWSKRTETISLLLFNADMKLIKENRLANGERAFGVAYTAFKKIGNKFWLFYTEPGERTGFGDFKVMEVDAASLETGLPKTIASTAKEGLKLDVMTSIALIDIDFKTSPNEKYGCLFIKAGKKNGLLYATNGECNILWSRKEIVADIGTEPGDVKSWQVDNQGNVYLGYVENNLGHVAVYKNSNAPQILNVSLDNGKPKEVLLLANKKGTSITIAGSYFENTKNLRGVYKGVIDASNTISNIVKTPFSDEIIKQFDNDSWGSTKPNKYGIEPNCRAQLFEVDDNTVDMVIEIKKMDYQERVGLVVRSGNILNVYFNNNAAFFTRIPKFSVAVGDDRNRYYAVPFQKKMIIFYNDNPVNLTRDINASPKLVDIQDNSVLVAAVIEPDGSMQRQSPLEITQNYMGIAEGIKPVATNSLQVPVYFKKKLGYATILIQ